ncbi:hypothetical protein [Candidatus Poriferisodalis sp.]|uniref:hypothetical protein n=1 Tax=Candidatus Poriferisodalis sp. TaxID=3101277 RepID=UPI003C701050
MGFTLRSCGRRRRANTATDHHCTTGAHWHGTTNCHTSTPANHHCSASEHVHGSNGCHSRTPSDHHCSSSEHKHGTYGCHTSTLTNHHCSTGEHQHPHGSGTCHSSTPADHHNDDGSDDDEDGSGSGNGDGEEAGDDDEQAGSDSGRPGRCDTNPPQTGCSQQGSDSDDSGGTTDPVAAAWGSLKSALEASGEAQIAQSEAYEALGEVQKEQVRAVVDALSEAFRDMGESGVRPGHPLAGHLYAAEAQGIADLWNALPEPAQSIVVGGVCSGIGFFVGGGLPGAIGFGLVCATAFEIQQYYTQPSADDDSSGSDDDVDTDDEEADNADTDVEEADDADTSTGTYCSAWTSFAFMGLPHHGEVVLYENGVGTTSIQGSQAWATARCPAALAALGQ